MIKCLVKEYYTFNLEDTYMASSNTTKCKELEYYNYLQIIFILVIGVSLN